MCLLIKCHFYPGEGVESALGEHGNIIKYKARLTTQDCFQTFGVDFMDRYAPVASVTTVRSVFALAVMLTFHVSGVNFTNAFLNAPLMMRSK